MAALRSVCWAFTAATIAVSSYPASPTADDVAAAEVAHISGRCAALIDYCVGLPEPLPSVHDLTCRPYLLGDLDCTFIFQWAASSSPVFRRERLTQTAPHSWSVYPLERHPPPETGEAPKPIKPAPAPRLN